MPLAARLHWGAVLAAVLECLVFAAAGGLNFWLYGPTSGRIDPAAAYLTYLASFVLFALAAGFGFGAFLLSLHWHEVRIIGAVSHLTASALAALAGFWLAVSEMQADPSSYPRWIPGTGVALAVAVIAIGIAVLASLVVPAPKNSIAEDSAANSAS